MTSASVNFTDASDFYDLKVQDAVKLTTSGTFLHAAPWNDGKFGRVNGSHGCIAPSLDDAAWFFNTVKVGDVVNVLQSSDTKPNVTTNSMPGFRRLEPELEPVARGFRRGGAGAVEFGRCSHRPRPVRGRG